MTQTLTKAQAKAFAFLVDYIDKHGYGPSIRQMCRGLGMSSTSSVVRLITELEQRGFLVGRPGQYREAGAFEFADLPTLPKADLYLRLLIDQITQNGSIDTGNEIYQRIKTSIDSSGATQ